MKKIVIIGANSFQNPLILKAKEMGIETHVFAWKDGAIGEKTADYFYPISITEKEKILEICKQIKPNAVCTIASDLANITVQYLAKHLDLPCNTEDTIKVSTNKYKMRKRFIDCGVETPKFIEIERKEDIGKIDFTHFHFPLIVKPTDRSGSRGINKVSNIDEIYDVIDDSLSQSIEHKAIIEEYIEGDEYSCECISYNGNHNLLAVTKKYTTGHPHFIETGHIEPSGLNDEEIENVKKYIFQALDALNIEMGPSHSEFKIDDKGNIRIIEIGSRMGGDCIGSDLVRISTGYDFVKMTIETAFGQKPNFTKITTPKYAGIKFIFTRKDYDCYIRLQAERPECIYYFSGLENEWNTAVVDSSSRKGYYILACNTLKDLLYCMEKK